MKQITKPIKGKVYAFDSRYAKKVNAAKVAKEINGEKHTYYVRVKEKGNEYWDVRIES